MAELTVRAGHPDFLDLPWGESVVDWTVPHMIALPKGISRHEVRFLQYPQGIYVVKELPLRPAQRDYSGLRSLEGFGTSAVRPIALVEERTADPREERSAALITAYEPFSFSYRELLAGPGFGPRRNQMLDAFARLLTELHLANVFWGDCSLSNVLYRFDAESIETIMVDAETAYVYDEPLTEGRRTEDIAIMIENVAGGMADIAAEAGHDLDEADFELGIDIADRYGALWEELTSEQLIGAEERYKITDRIARINALGFDIDEIDLVPAEGDGSRLRVKLQVGGRTYHTNRLKELTGVDALENQARQILTDLHYFHIAEGVESPVGKNVTAVRWRVEVFEPMLDKLSNTKGVADPVQAYCDLLHHRYVMAEGMGVDVTTEAAYADWLARGRPGYPLA